MDTDRDAPEGGESRDEPAEASEHQHPQPFMLPIPPPFHPAFGVVHPDEAQDVIFFARAPAPPATGRDAEDIMLRRVPVAVAKQFRAAAGGRAMTHAQYLAALVALHDAMRALGDGGDARIQAELEQLGLSTVTV